MINLATQNRINMSVLLVVVTVDVFGSGQKV